MFDVLIRNGTVVDGTGRPRFQADVAVRDGRIADVGQFPAARAQQVIDARGLIVAPGFVDTHVHSDLMLLADPQHPQGILQGITTEVLGQDGLSYAPLSYGNLEMYRRYLAGLNGNPDIAYDWRSVREFRTRFDRTVAVNTVYQVPHGALRLETVGFRDVPLAGEALDRARQLLRQAFAEGAVAFSTGMSYYPCSFSDTAEMIALCQATREMDGLYVTHQRSVFRKGQQPFDPTGETLEIARRSGVKVHFSHYRTGPRNVGQAEKLMEPIEAGIRAGLDLSLELYPYPQGSGYVVIFLPIWAVDGGYWEIMKRLADPGTRKEIASDLDPVVRAWHPTWDDAAFTYIPSARNRWMVGKTFAEAAAIRGTAPEELICEVLCEEGLEVGFRGTPPRDPAVWPELDRDFLKLLSKPYYMVGSDSIPVGTQPHPRGWGCFPRFLRLQRQHPELISLETMINRMAYAPAQRFKLHDRGEVAPGKAADVVVFTAETVADLATYENPCRYPAGIDHVLVNGQVAVEFGKCTGVYAGRALPL